MFLGFSKKERFLPLNEITSVDNGVPGCGDYHIEKTKINKFKQVS